MTFFGMFTFSRIRNLEQNTLNQSTKGFQNFSSVPVLHYLQAVLFLKI